MSINNSKRATMDIHEKFKLMAEIDKLSVEIGQFIQSKNVSDGHAFSALAFEIKRLAKSLKMPNDVFEKIFSLVEERQKNDEAQKVLMDSMFNINQEGKSS